MQISVETGQRCCIAIIVDSDRKPGVRYSDLNVVSFDRGEGISRRRREKEKDRAQKNNLLDDQVRRRHCQPPPRDIVHTR